MARPKKFSRPGVPVPARPAKESNAKASSSKTGSDGPDRRKRGFQVGPAHAPRNAYLGKVKKIKDDLIVKAKLKKQYAKVLKETGGTSDRLRDRNASREEKPATGEEGEDEGTREDDEAGPSDRASTPRGKGSKPGKLDRKPPKDLRATGEASSASVKGDHRQPGLKRKRSDAEGATEPRPTDATSTTAQPRKVRALSPSDISAPMPQTSFRELKKEAFRKYHPARPHSSAAAPQTHAAGRRTFSGASHASHVSGPPGAGKAMRGQPNMAARMGVLLEKIKRDKTA